MSGRELARDRPARLASADDAELGPAARASRPSPRAPSIAKSSSRAHRVLDVARPRVHFVERRAALAVRRDRNRPTRRARRAAPLCVATGSDVAVGQRDRVAEEAQRSRAPSFSDRADAARRRPSCADWRTPARPPARAPRSSARSRRTACTLRRGSRSAADVFAAQPERDVANRAQVRPSRLRR